MYITPTECEYRKDRKKHEEEKMNKKANDALMK